MSESLFDKVARCTLYLSSPLLHYLPAFCGICCREIKGMLTSQNLNFFFFCAYYPSGIFILIFVFVFAAVVMEYENENVLLK